MRFVQSSAAELTEMVNDLLDLAKVEAGRVTISPAWFEMVDLFSALRERGMRCQNQIGEVTDEMAFGGKVGFPSFYVLREERRDLYAHVRRALLDGYAADGLAWRGDIEWFVGCALLLGLDRLVARPEKKWEPKVDGLLGECRRALLAGRVSAGPNVHAPST